MCFKFTSTIHNILNADALMYAAECLKDEQTGILNEVPQASHQEEIINQNLQSKRENQY